ncbi:MAG: hypothetical protein GKR89_31710 [Candidatus Latescibacteria bacterium]|nr:hypothetical protein [Candidatus Latescibacterota bacterium]
MSKKWLRFSALLSLVPCMALAQSEIAVENTGIVERPIAEGGVVQEATYVHTILWTDGSGASYNIYVSDAPITDIDAGNVFRIATEIPEATQNYAHALLTPFAPGDVSNYYAVTMVDAGGTESSTVTAGVNATSAATSGTADFGQPLWWFLDEPFIDGEIDEWTFDPVSMSPDDPNHYVAGEIDGPADYSWDGAMGVDDNALYLMANATDDVFVNTIPIEDAGVWQGDSPEFYIGLYDLRPSVPRHPTPFWGNESDPSNADTDWQLMIGADAADNPARGWHFPGTHPEEFRTNWAVVGGEVFFTETAEGWRGEVRLPWTALAPDAATQVPFAPKIGMILPAQYAGNDGDDPAGGRQGQLHWAQDEAANNSWNTPSAWEKVQVIYDPKVFGLGGGGTAVEEKTWGEIKSSMGQ